MPSGWCDLSVRMGLPGAADDLARTVYAKVKSSAPVVAVAGGRLSRVEWYEKAGNRYRNARLIPGGIRSSWP